MKFDSPYLVKPHSVIDLTKFSTSDTGDFKSEDDTTSLLLKHRKDLDALQEVLYASASKAVLIILQGVDTAGKDGTIRHIFSGINPQGCNVTAFKVPTISEARHDFLWRAHTAMPPRGMIGIFNRSHYEDVLVPAVHKVISQKDVMHRLEDINAFEDMLVDNNVVVLKFFLHISHKEQAGRLKSRMEDPAKRWKLDPADFRERKLWPKYQHAYEHILETTSRKHAPWFVIPSDHKWYRNIAISEILVREMKTLKLRYPEPHLNPHSFAHPAKSH